MAAGEGCETEAQLLGDDRGRVATCFFLGEVYPFSYMSVIGMKSHICVRKYLQRRIVLAYRLCHQAVCLMLQWIILCWRVYSDPDCCLSFGSRMSRSINRSVMLSVYVWELA